MSILFILWFYILPILGVLVPIFGLIFWFFVVPGVARMLTWNRFKPVSLHLIHDASGFAELVPTKEVLPENVERTKRSWHFLPRPAWRKREYDDDGNRKELTDDEKGILEAEKIATQKYILKHFGKPIWIDYAGKITSMNAGALAGTQQKEDNPERALEGLQEYVETLPKEVVDPKTAKKIKIRENMKKLVTEIINNVKAKAVTLIDPDHITQAVEELYPPSVIDAIAVNREMKGLKRRGKEMIPLILGGAIILAIVVLGALAIMSM